MFWFSSFVSLPYWEDLTLLTVTNGTAVRPTVAIKIAARNRFGIWLCLTRISVPALLQLLLGGRHWWFCLSTNWSISKIWCTLYSIRCRVGVIGPKTELKQQISQKMSLFLQHIAKMSRVLKIRHCTEPIAVTGLTVEPATLPTSNTVFYNVFYVYC